MNNLDKQYTDLLQDILDNGVTKQDRTGTGTLSVFGRQIRHKMSEGFPLLTTKKMPFRLIATELLWFLRGDTNIKFLVDNDCHIWDGDAYKNYLKNWEPDNTLEELDDPYGLIRGTNLIDSRPLAKDMFIHCIKVDDEFAKQWGELGPVYGKQWRGWKSASLEEQWGYGSIEGHPRGGKQYSKFNTNVQIDQITNLIHDLKTNPDSRRLMVNAWNVGELDQMVLPPCHYGFQVYTRELTIYERAHVARISTKNKQYGFEVEDHWIDGENDLEIKHVLNNLNIPTRAISLMWNQRSVDTFLGLPFNIASYGLLLEIIAKETNMVPDELIGNLGDTHLYLNHVEQAKEQIGKIPWEERKEMLTDPIDIREFGNITPFTEPVIHHWLNYKNIPYSRRMPYPLPTLVINDEFWNPDADLLSNLPHIQVSDFYVDNYQSHPSIKAPLSN
jgi:thymidylate synthase